MGDTTGIAWTQSTFNPWIGCTKVSPGCANCYAEVSPASKFSGVEWGTGKPRRRTVASNWSKPLRWNTAAKLSGERHLVFCASLSDWLDDAVPVEWLADLLGLIASTPKLSWQLLTKRPENWKLRLTAVVSLQDVEQPRMGWRGIATAIGWLRGNAPANVWVGTTVEDQKRADERIPHLLAIPAAVRFLSVEPQIEAIDLQANLGGTIESREVQNGWHGIHWVIVGGESGHKARPFDLAWMRSIIASCAVAVVPVFCKQLGAKPFVVDIDYEEAGGRPFAREVPRALNLRDSHGGDWNEWPADLRVRQFPEVSNG